MNQEHMLTFKPYDVSLGFSEHFSSHFLVCIAGGSLLWNFELKEVSQGLFSLTFLLVPWVTYEFYIHYSYYVVLIRVFICSDTLWWKILSQSTPSLPPTHTSDVPFWGFWEMFLFIVLIFNKGNDIGRIASLLSLFVSSCSSLVFPLLSLFNLPDDVLDVLIDANGCSLATCWGICSLSILGVGIHCSRARPQQYLCGAEARSNSSVAWGNDECWERGLSVPRFNILSSYPFIWLFSFLLQKISLGP